MALKISPHPERERSEQSKDATASIHVRRAEMSGPLRITAEVEGAEAALEMAAMLDELSGAVAAFET